MNQSIFLALLLIGTLASSPLCKANNVLAENEKYAISKSPNDLLQRKPPKMNRSFSPKNPWVAGALSIVPGLGQIYNGKKNYWKAPLMITGVGLLYIAVAYNTDRYNWFRNGYNLYLTEGVNGAEKAHHSVQSYVKNADSINLLRGRDFYLSQRDFWTIFMVVGWIANILEAITSAHFSTFDITDDISLRIRPTLMENNPNRFYAGNISAGVALTLTF